MDRRLPPERQQVYEQYRPFDLLDKSQLVVWREVAGRVELALYRMPDRLHRLPFSPLEYVQTGVALRFIEHWYLFFMAEDEQAAYADLLTATAYYVQQLFPDAAPLLPAHWAARAATPARPPGPDYRARLTAAARHLRSVPGLTVTGEGLRPGASLHLLDRARREMGRPLPAALLAFYGQCNGHDLHWEWSGTYAGGALDLLPLEQTLGGPRRDTARRWGTHVYDGRLWGAGHLDYVLDRLARQGHRLQLPATGLKLSDHAADTVWGGLTLREDVPEEAQLWPLASDDLDDLQALPLSSGQYLEQALATRGVANWQSFFLAAPPYPAVAAQVQADLARLGLPPLGTPRA